MLNEYSTYKPIYIKRIFSKYKLKYINQINPVILKDFPNYKIYRHGFIYNIKLNIFMKIRKTKNDYYKVDLIDVNGKPKTVRIHRLLALAYICNPDPISKDQINHIDGDKYNNSLDNLEWCSYSENIEHSRKLGLKHYSDK